MDHECFSAQWIGSQADQPILHAGGGLVIGQTSGGVFLSTDTGWVLFLSFTAWRGPLTVNLPPAAGESLRIDIHSPFQVQSGRLFFPSAPLTIQLDRAEIWSPPPRPLQMLSPIERSRRYARVAGQVYSRREPDPNLIGLSGFMALPAGADLQAAFSTGQVAGILQALLAGLGSGAGLTPAGDDLALGFLLALNRWGDRLHPHLPLDRINRTLVEAARQNTTALSASLIECAAGGSADERLISALDGLVSGSLEEEHIIEHLLGWGHSSGAAAMQGMGLAFG